MTISQFVISRRRTRHLTQRGLAERAGVSAEYIRKLELDQITNPTVSTLVALAAALSVAPSELLQYFTKETP